MKVIACDAWRSGYCTWFYHHLVPNNTPQWRTTQPQTRYKAMAWWWQTEIRIYRSIRWGYAAQLLSDLYRGTRGELPAIESLGWISWGNFLALKANIHEYICMCPQQIYTTHRTLAQNEPHLLLRTYTSWCSWASPLSRHFCTNMDIGSCLYMCMQPCG